TCAVLKQLFPAGQLVAADVWEPEAGGAEEPMLIQAAACSANSTPILRRRRRWPHLRTTPAAKPSWTATTSLRHSQKCRKILPRIIFWDTSATIRRATAVTVKSRFG